APRGGVRRAPAAMLVKPYNEFFKAAVASAGNHDNNIYNNTWAEHYHGLKEIIVKKEAPKKDEKKAEAATGAGDAKDDQDEGSKQDEKKDEKKTDDGKVEKKDDT